MNKFTILKPEEFRKIFDNAYAIVADDGLVYNVYDNYTTEDDTTCKAFVKCDLDGEAEVYIIDPAWEEGTVTYSHACHTFYFDLCGGALPPFKILKLAVPVTPNWTWTIHEHKFWHTYVLTLYKDGQFALRLSSSNAEEAGEWWFAMMHHATPDALFEEPDAWQSEQDWDDYRGPSFMQESVRIVENGFYDETSATPWSEELKWQYTKLYATRVNTNSTPDTEWDVEIVPSWALNYLANGDTDDLSEEEIASVTAFEKEWHVTSSSPSSVLQKCPWSGKLTDCHEVIVTRHRE